MDLSLVMDYFTKYGMIAVFVIVFLEYLNLPGFPAGIIMPVAGVMAARGNNSFFVTIIVSTLAGILGSILLYCLGRFGGVLFSGFLKRRMPKQEVQIQNSLEWLRGKGYTGVFVAKLIPAVRTIVSIPAGMIGLNPVKYVLYSGLGVLIWNTVFIGAGFFLGDKAITMIENFAM